MNPSYFQNPQLIPLPVLIEDARNGNMLIPRFQRGFVWKSKDVTELLDSISKGIPIGSLLVWRTTQFLATFPKVGGVEVPLPTEGNSPKQYLLDGQQRVSSLVAAFSPPREKGGATKENSQLEPGSIVYDLEAEVFMTRTAFTRKKSQQTPEPLPLHLLFSSGDYLEFLRKNYKKASQRKLTERADKLVQRFRESSIPVVPIITDDLSLALDAFNRVNRSGVRLNDVDMVHALSYTADFNLTARIKTQLEALDGIGWGTLDPKFFLATWRALNELEPTRPEPKATVDLLRKVPQSIEATTEALRTLAAWLWEHCSVPVPALVPYSYQIPLLAVFLKEHEQMSNVEQGRCSKWFWKASLTGILRNARDSDYAAAKASLEDFVKHGQHSDPSDYIPRNSKVSLTQGDFNFQKARVKVLILQMIQKARTGMDPSELAEFTLHMQQNADGRTCLAPIFKRRTTGNQSSSGARFLALSISEQKGFEPTQLLVFPKMRQEQMLITETCIGLLTKGKLEEFIDARSANLRVFEANFIRTQDLIPIEPGASSEEEEEEDEDE
jgi:hypothetical protein